MQEFENLKAAVAAAVVEMLAAIAKIQSAVNPAEIQAEADKLAEATAALKAAVEA